MEVILKKDFISLGYEGDICKVKDGYARNYLIPRNIAVIKNAANLKTLAQMQKSLEKKRAKRKMEAEILKGKIVDISVVIPMKVAENGKLYGSVSQQTIVDALKEKEIDINKRDVHMEKHIKELGEFDVEIKLYHSVNAVIKIKVVNIDDKEVVEVTEEIKEENNNTSETVQA
ncbi:50S ribosomal protein L9 [Brachyspira sp. G79]|uniref:50S ribosomal protein L9 n=1 Tax=Brachyspira sp. G79 TaxID=1358104 RepID=UPI000BBCDC59|nr:50S ribosomal protein L9 [Brachyspira sp. G79]PCG19397.1 50S ribosomal protein L9 [Brachyspira sp. G79]